MFFEASPQGRRTKKDFRRLVSNKTFIYKNFKVIFGFILIWAGRYVDTYLSIYYYVNYFF